jgi:hypothetical protein
LAGGRAGAVDPLSSWNDGATKKSITDFVAAGQFSPSAIRTVTIRLLEWTAAGDGARFTGLVDHTDAVRELPTTGNRILAGLTRRSTRQRPEVGPSST